MEEYIRANETDFITFMARILLKDVEDDPTARANVITRIVKTIALIPNEITRSVYVQECSRILFISEEVLQRQVGIYYNEYALKSREDKLREASLTMPQDVDDGAADADAARADAEAEAAQEAAGGQAPAVNQYAPYLRRYEMALMQLVARYGNYAFAEVVGDNDEMVPMTVLGYIESDLQADGIELVNPDLRHFLMAARRLSN